MKNAKIIHHYGKHFNTTAADIIVPFIIEIFSPASVVDIGCGIGTWLKVFKENGVADILGIDGHHVSDTGRLLIPGENFVAKDLKVISFGEFKKKFDMALCLEVAEHLKEEYADNLVAALCSFSDVIVFSAAMPGQTGENHLNEQYPTYWSKKFLDRGFVFVDLIRSKFWNVSEIEWWYRQNAFIVVKSSLAAARNFTQWDEKIYVINDMLERYTEALNSRNSSDAFSSKALLKVLLNRLLSKFRLRADPRRTNTS